MRIVVGTMTGTSMDGVDAVAVQIEGKGNAMSASFLDIASLELGAISTTLRELASQKTIPLNTDDAATEVGRITAKSIEQLQLPSVDLIALHGQTIFHHPPNSLQLIDPTPVIELFQCPVFTDPRQADLQLGGQGAPITPLADWIMFRSLEKSTAIVNLGGFCNVTIMPASCTPKDISGSDVCSCNLLLNTIAREQLGTEFDTDGYEALKGTVDENVRDMILQKLESQRAAGNSLGTGDDLGMFAVKIGKGLCTQDLLASATAAIGLCINTSTTNAEQVFLAGGGVNNQALQKTIRHNGTTAVMGVPIQAREGMAMAILCALAQDGVSITLPQITGRQETTELVGWAQASP